MKATDCGGPSEIRPGKGRRRPRPQRTEARPWRRPRTFSLVGHRSSGKTSLGEMLIQAGRVTRTVGSVQAGTSLLDHSPEARRHQQTLALSTAWMEHEGVTLQLLDTPGVEYLSHERDRAIRASDAVLLAVDAAEGVQVGLVGAAAAARAAGVPLLAAVTKADRPDAQPVEVLAERLHAALVRESDVAPRVVPMWVPLLEAGALVGVIDVLRDRVLRYDEADSGRWSPEPVPPALRARTDAALERVAEAVALTNDELLEQYLEDLRLPVERIEEGLALAVSCGAIIPMWVTSWTRRLGAQPLLDALSRWVPSGRPVRVRAHDGQLRNCVPADGFVAEVLSVTPAAADDGLTLLRVWSGRPPRGPWLHGRSGQEIRNNKLYRVRGPRRAQAREVGPGSIVGTWEPLGLRPGDTLTSGARFEVVAPRGTPPTVDRWIQRPADAVRADALEEALQRVVAADDGLALHTDAVTGAVLIAGRSDSHLGLALERIERLSGAPVEVALPPVAYREIPSARVEGIQAVHLREGDHGLVSEYGKCQVDLEPTRPEDTPRFVDAIGESDDDLPRRYRPAIDVGVREALRHGPTAGYPVVGVEMRLTGGDYNILQSTDDHFRLAGQKATRLALQRAGTTLLEPWVEMEVDAPQEVLGNLLSDISAHRGRIVGMEVAGKNAQVVAQCPYREVRTFGARLDGLSGGRGRFQTRRSHYEPLPGHLVAEAIAASPFRGA